MTSSVGNISAFDESPVLRRSVTWIAGCVATAAALAIPALYFFTAHSYESARIEAATRAIAAELSEMAYTNPTVWQYDNHSLEALAGSERYGKTERLHQLFDKSGGLLAEWGRRPTAPTVSHVADIFSYGDVVGHVTITEPLQPVLVATGWVALFGVGFAVIVFVVLRLIPLRALRKALGDLEQQVTERKRAEEKLAGVLENLEKLVEERSTQLRLSNEELRREIAERKRAEEALLAAKEAAQLANRSKSEFLANMSHELRTPLAAIIGHSEVLREELQEAGHETYLPDLETIESSSKHLIGLINDVLDLSKIEAGKMDLAIETFAISEVVDEVVKITQPLVAKNHDKLEVRCPADAGHMSADQTKIRQVLFNLLSNAAKFTTDGHIVLDVGRETDDENDWVLFRVRDTGIGMSREELDRVFQEFVQADASTTRKFGGTGLGLPIARRFCQIMGGGITAESEPGKGSTVTVRLPADVGAAVPGAYVLPGPAEAIEVIGESVFSPEIGGRVVVIDDDPVARELLARSLTREGVHVATAENGEDGLALVRDFKPAAIILDVLMPGMDGWSVLEALKADPELTDIPTIMCTIIDDRNKGYSLGAADYLLKPIDRRRLVKIFSNWCSSPPGRALVVEDEPGIRNIVVRTLTKAGWRVTEAENGRVALERLAEARPDVILLDLMMPEMDGFEFLEKLRKSEDFRTTPVVVVTAKDLSEADHRRLNGGVQTILQKGAYSSDEICEELCTMVTRMLPRQKTSAA